MRPDKCRFIIEEARTNRILTRDLSVQNVKILKKLSGPTVIEFDVDYRHPSTQHPDGGGPIVFKPWGHWCHVEKEIRGERKIIASALFKPSEIDADSGILHAQWEGFTGYPNDIPWLENWNPIAVDPFEIVDRIWKHLQSYSNAKLGVKVYSLGPNNERVMPPTSNTLLLPGFSYGGTQDFVMDFFAIFIRRVDFTECGDYINKLARDIPFDYFEESEWNEDHTRIDKYIQLAYPHGGVLQSNLVFRQNENVLKMKSRTESEIEWASDVIIRGWFPGKVYSSQISNPNSTQYRRTVMEEDARINSTERSQAWAHRQLSRRQFPSFWETITINANHPNAPFGSWAEGDQIRIQGNMPWIGEVDQVHKIVAWALDETTQTCELSLRAEGAFNYDPIFFDGANSNMLVNPSFTTSMFSWTEAEGNWTRDSLVGSNDLGAARISCNANRAILISESHPVKAGDKIGASCSVAWKDFTGQGEPLCLAVNLYDKHDDIIQTIVYDSTEASGTSADWVVLSNQTKIPADGDPVSMRVLALITAEAAVGRVWYDQFYLTKARR